MPCFRLQGLATAGHSLLQPWCACAVTALLEHRHRHIQLNLTRLQVHKSQTAPAVPRWLAAVAAALLVALLIAWSRLRPSAVDIARHVPHCAAASALLGKPH